jgi:DNA-binding MarR family transcriptional regulator
MESEDRELQKLARTIGGQCLARRARLLSRKLTRIYDEALRPAGLTSSQLNILVAIAANPGSHASDLHRRLELEQSSFSRNASLMERRGWIEKRATPGDRGRELALTKDGASLLAEVLPLWRSAQRRATSMLGSNARAFTEIANQQLPK